MTESPDQREEPVPETASAGASPAASSPRSRISVTDRTAAVVAASVAVAALVALVVSLVKGEGTNLTHIALALAVIAFGLQIGFFAVQLWLASEQERRNRDLFGETRVVLAQIEASTSQTVEVIKEQFAFVLEHALESRPVTDVEAAATPGETAAATSSEPRPGESQADAAARGVVGALESINAKLDALAGQTVARQAALQRWDNISAGRDQRRHQNEATIEATLRSWPDEQEGRRALVVREALSDRARQAIDNIARRRLAILEDRSDHPGKLTEFPVDEPPDALAELANAGLIRAGTSYDASGVERPSVMMTPDGRGVGRFGTAAGPEPDWYAKATGGDRAASAGTGGD